MVALALSKILKEAGSKTTVQDQAATLQRYACFPKVKHKNIKISTLVKQRIALCLRLRVEDGKLVLPSGTSYQQPDCERLAESGKVSVHANQCKKQV